MIISTLIILTQNNRKRSFNSVQKFCYFFLFLLQKMENKVMNERAKIINAVKKFRENLTLHGDKSTEIELKLLEKSIKFHEDLPN